MHHIHRTKAFVIGSSPFSEADKQLFLLTRELGFVRAIAQGSRKQESKMRQSVQDYSLVDAALVSGRAGWRLVNAAPMNNFYREIKNSDLREALCRVFSLINRLIAGEVPDVDFFDLIDNFVDFASAKEELLSNREIVDNFETILNARILNLLGYLNIENFENYISEDMSISLLEQFSVEKTSDKDELFKNVLIKEINNGIRDSNL